MSKHLIEDEFERRMSAGATLTSINDEASALLAWLIEAHPQMPRPTQKTVENNIRAGHRRSQTSPAGEPKRPK